MPGLKVVLEQANRAPLHNKPAPIDNTDLVRQFREGNGHILHLRPGDALVRGVTFAYVRRGSRITFSTAVQHRADAFTKKMGTKTAIEHFLAGKTVTMPLPNASNPVWALSAMAEAFG